MNTLNTPSIKIALIGYGKMGKCIEQAALHQGHSITARINQAAPLDSQLSAIQTADVCIDFSKPECVVEHVSKLARMGKQIVLGTTGWHADLPQVEEIVLHSGIGLIWAPNFSLGVHLFLKIAAEAAKLINLFPDYDVGGHEVHHCRKVDSPSGTAKTLCETLLKEIKRKQKVIHHLENRAIAADELLFTSERIGSVPGTHTVLFDSPADSISLSHIARSRDGFATGAVAAANWIVGKQGLFTIDHLINQLAGDV